MSATAARNAAECTRTRQSSKRSQSLHTTERLRNGVFRSVPELVAAIQEYIALHNKNPKPFVWTAKAKDILAKVIRANRHLSSKQNEALH